MSIIRQILHQGPSLWDPNALEASGEDLSWREIWEQVLSGFLWLA